MAGFDYFTVLEDIDLTGLDEMLKTRRVDVYSYLLLAHGRDCRREQRRDGGQRADRGGAAGLARVAHRSMTHQKDRTRQNSRFSRSLLTDPGAAHDLMRQLGLTGCGAEAFLALPGAARLEFTFRLEKAYLSRDDAPFYPIDNPVRKERIFKAPMVSGASWKGALRAAAVEGLVLRSATDAERVEERLDLIDIFGDEKGGSDFEEDNERGDLAGYLDKEFRERKILEAYRQRHAARFGLEREDDEYYRKGRIRILPSYFDAIEVDVINPRNRKTRAGTQPIQMEIVPPGACAVFTLLYAPFDLLGRPGSIPERCRRDWELLGEALVRMLRYTGFGAKKSSGAGKASAEISGFRLDCKLDAFRPAAVNNLEQLATLHACFGVAA
jgi:CRISPR-associated protein Cmr2